VSALLQAMDIERTIRMLIRLGMSLDGYEPRELVDWIDLLLDTATGWVIVDHKSFGGSSSRWPELALSHSGQLEAYRRAVELATGRAVVGTWVHFPVGGGLVEVKGVP
jgi:hypothetical protein